MARDVALTFGGRLALTAAMIVGDVIVARALGPDGKGAFALVLNLTSLGAIILALGLERSLAVFAGRSLEIARRAFANSVVWAAAVGAIGALAIVVLYGPSVPRQPPTGPLAALLPTLSPLELLTGALALPAELAFGIGMIGLLGRQRVIAFNVARFLRRGALTFLLIPVLLLGRVQLEVVLILNLVALVITLAMIGWAMWRAGMVGFSFTPRLLLEQLSFGGRAVAGTVAERVHFRANTFLLNAVVGVAATGVFSVALALAETLWYLPAAFGTVLFSRAIAGGRGGPAVASAMTRTMLALMVLAAIPLGLLAPTMVTLVYGAPFAQAGQALQIMLPGVLAYSVVVVLSNPLIAWGAPGRLAAVLIAGMAINLVANAVLIPSLGLNGAAAASAISYTATAVLTVVLYHRMTGQGFAETLVVRRADFARAWQEVRGRLRHTQPRRA